MQEMALERLNALYLWPLPLIEDAFSCHKNIGRVLVLLACGQVLELHIPLISRFTPSCTNALLLEAHVLPDVVFGGNILPILKDLGC